MPPPPPNHTRTTAYPDYIYEILDHAGLCHARLAVNELEEALSKIRILVTIGDGLFEDAARVVLKQWLDAGGAWIAVGGVCGMADAFGVEVEGPSYSGWGTTIGVLGEGYMRAATQHPILDHVSLPLHFFNGLPVRAETGEVLATVLNAHQQETPRAALVEHRTNRGRTLLLAPDVTGTVVHIQQGTAVTRDRVPSDDGIGGCNDLVLKSEDGAVLDYIFDRQSLPEIPGYRAFFEPIADLWREVLLRAILYCARAADVAVPVLWLYPRNVPALGHISHDTDGNDVPHGEMILDALTEAGVKSTWCTIVPGYPRELTRRIEGAGHELAMHYDAVSEHCPWSRELFDRQFDDLTALFGRPPVSNKNHYLRWEGDTDFFDWCLRRGIQMDSSKGPSKTGFAGFNFGTCHPHLPVAPEGGTLDVFELPTLSQDLCVFAPPVIADKLIAASHRVHGICHLLFHPAHIDKPGVRDAFLSSIARGKALGMEWWTAEAVNAWERARRTAQFAQNKDNGVSMTTSQRLEDATLLLSATDDLQETDVVERWGFRFKVTVATIEAGKPFVFE